VRIRRETMKGIDHWKPIPLIENVVDGCKVTLVFDNENGKTDAKESIEKILMTSCETEKIPRTAC
jgi:hypothetical protein